MKTEPLNRGHRLYKYYMQRYNLFTRYDDGILLDDESWYSVTPENIAEHISDRIHKSLGDGQHLILDGFCGVGGNLIQFARSSPFTRVIGCDIVPDRIRMAKHNSKIYGVEHQCEFILGDFMDIMQTLKDQRVDAVFLSPPWGGIEYQAQYSYSLSSMTPDGYDLVKICRKNITNNIAFLMPRNTDLEELRSVLLDRDHPEFEVEHNMVGAKTKTITAYFGDLVVQSPEQSLKSESSDYDDDD